MGSIIINGIENIFLFVFILDTYDVVNIYIYFDIFLD